MNISYTLLVALLLSVQDISCSSSNDIRPIKRRRIVDSSESKTDNMTAQAPNPGSEEQLVFENWFEDAIQIFPLNFERKDEDTTEAHDMTEAIETTEGAEVHETTEAVGVALNNPAVEASAGLHTPPRHQQIPTGANTLGAFAFSHLFDLSSYETPPHSDHSPFHVSEINSPAVTVDSNATSLYSAYSAGRRAGNAPRLASFGIESDAENGELESEAGYSSEFGTSEFGSVAGEDEQDPDNDYGDDEASVDENGEHGHATNCS